MIPVRTRNKHEPANGEWGDCLRASLASILELQIDEVPHFMDGGPSAGDLDAAMAGWLELRGLGQVVIHAPGELAAILKNLESVAPGAFYLLGGTSRNGLEHCVVGCGGSIAHDPSDACIVGPLSNGHYRIVFLTPFARRSAALKAAALPAPAIDTTPLGRHSKVGVMFSGGKDSLALAYLLRAQCPQITFYHLDTGDLLPETVEAVRAVEAMVPRFCRITTNVKDWILTNGLPSDLVPSSCTVPGLALAHGQGGGRRIVDAFTCCTANRWEPLRHRILNDGVTLIVRGGRQADPGMGLVWRAPGVPIGECSKGIDGVEHWFPLLRWSAEDVLGYLRSVGAPVGKFYSYRSQAPECATCPAHWDEGRAAYLQEHHPDLARRYHADLAALRREIAPWMRALNSELGK